MSTPDWFERQIGLNVYAVLQGRGTVHSVQDAAGDVSGDGIAAESGVGAVVDGMSAADAVVLDGPWLSGFLLEVPLPLRSKSNFRRHQRNAGSSGWSEQRQFEQSVGWFLRAARPEVWSVGDMTVPVSARPVVVACIVARSTVDASNFSKSVLDAGEGVLYVSDASVLGVSSVGVRGRGGSTFVGFAQIAPSSSPKEVHDALMLLGGMVVDRFSARSDT